jgi:N-succinyldiaminopimelate aminotransferase
VTLRAPAFRLDTDELRQAVTRRTKVILLNTPHNPTGTVLSRAELAAVAEVAVEHDLIVISDEVYEHLVFAGTHIPIATLPGMRERTVRISSAGKTFSLTGWKIGWATAPPDLLAAVRTAKQFHTFTSGAPFQPAVAEALALPDSYFDELREDMRSRRDLLADGLAELGFGVYRPQGTYFLTTDLGPFGYRDGMEFCRQLPHRAKVVAIPHQVFYDHEETGAPFVRWAFCKRPELLRTALDRLRACCT